MSIPAEESRWSQEAASPISSVDVTGFNSPASDKTESKYSNSMYAGVGASLSSGVNNSSPSTSSSLNLSNPNISSAQCQFSSGDFNSHDPNFLHSVQSLEHDLDFILENRDLNPFFEDMDGATCSADRAALNRADNFMESDDEDDACEFNVEDYLVDLDQYLDEQETGSVKLTEQDPSAIHDQRVLRKPNTNRTLPRNLRETSTAELKRQAATRNSVHLGREPNGK